MWRRMSWWWMGVLLLAACSVYGPRKQPSRAATSASPPGAATQTSPPSPAAALTATATPFRPQTPTATFLPTATATPTPTPVPASPTPWQPTVRFAVIGDFGYAGLAEAAVARLVHSWQPDFILTVGDNNYPDGVEDTVQANVLQYYGDDIRAGRFYPALGNHDWHEGHITAYLRYLRPPGGRRYYDFAVGPVHIFVLDSCGQEPDGITADSAQARWLREGLAAAREPWKIVVLHHPPYSSARHGSTKALQWPFAAWGAQAVIAGHDHVYERIMRDGIVYLVDGLGGVPGPYKFRPTPVPGTAVRYRESYGALQVTADARHLRFEFINIEGRVVDRYEMRR